MHPVSNSHFSLATRPQTDEKSGTDGAVKMWMRAFQTQAPPNARLGEPTQDLKRSANRAFLSGCLPISPLRQLPALERGASLTDILAEKADKAEIALPTLPATLSVDPDKEFVLVFHGTTETQHTSVDKLTNALVEEAATRENTQVVAVNGVASRADDPADKDYAAPESVLLLEAHKPKYSGKKAQQIRGNGMFKNAVEGMKAMAIKDGVMPGKIRVAGFSRGGVTGSIAIAVLDHMVSQLPSEQKAKIQISFSSLDPVPGPKKDSPLYSRDLLHKVSPELRDQLQITVAVAALEEKASILAPQPGEAPGEEKFILPTNHRGANNKDLDEKQNTLMSKINTFAARENLGFHQGDTPETRLQNELEALNANLELLDHKDDLANQKMKRPLATKAMMAHDAMFFAPALQRALVSFLPDPQSYPAPLQSENPDSDRVPSDDLVLLTDATPNGSGVKEERQRAKDSLSKVAASMPDQGKRDMLTAYIQAAAVRHGLS